MNDFESRLKYEMFSFNKNASSGQKTTYEIRTCSPISNAALNVNGTSIG